MFSIFKKYKEVINPYNVDDSKNFKGILLKTALQPTIVDTINTKNIEAVYLAHTAETKYDLSLLSNCTQLKEVNIICPFVCNIKSLYNIYGLEEISISCPIEEHFDFCNFNYLKKASIYWNKNTSSIFSNPSIEKLHVSDITDKKISCAKMKNLRDIDIRCSNIEDFSFLEKNKDIVKIRSDGNSIARLDGIAELTNLKYLLIRDSKYLSDIRQISNLTNLQTLILDNIGEIEDSAPLQNLKELTALSLSGSTSVKNGNLFFLEEIENLSMLSLSNHKHYSHKSIRPWNWDDFGKKGLSLFAVNQPS